MFLWSFRRVGLLSGAIFVNSAREKYASVRKNNAANDRCKVPTSLSCDVASIYGVVGNNATPIAKTQARYPAISSFRSYPRHDMRKTPIAHRLPTNTFRMSV